MYSIYEKLQEQLATQVITKDCFESIKTVCGVDVSYTNNDASAAAVSIDKQTLKIVEAVKSRSSVHWNYVPGLLFLREAKPAISAIKLLQKKYDLLLVDGHGQLHPRRFGLACYLGLALDKPTIGVAKTLLCGQVCGNNVTIDGKVFGMMIPIKKSIYVSVGHKISLDSATKIVSELVKKGEWYPEPLRLADLYSKNSI